MNESIYFSTMDRKQSIRSYFNVDSEKSESVIANNDKKSIKS